MTTSVVLLRGVNVGGAAKLPMAELRAEVGVAGFGAVRTYVASGNVVLTAGLDGSPSDTLDADAFAPEEFAADGDEVYLFLPDGMARRGWPMRSNGAQDRR
jgi:hypothetical protein